jgi:D-tyrosyl-tRNA(Tyr) deacylase
VRLPAYVVALSEPDPVARAVASELGVGEPTGASVGGVPVRWISESAVSLRRPGLHIFDEGLDVDLPEEWKAAQVPIVFPSVHRSESGEETLTVHPLGNPTTSAEVGGRPETLVPTAPRLMVHALRALTEGALGVGLAASYEATHHGPFLRNPAFFIEVGGKETDLPPPAAARLIAEVVRGLSEDSSDTVVLGVGGGHYAPHFTDLAVRRRLAFGHILPRHVLDPLTMEVARGAWKGTPGALGVVYARAADASRPVTQAWGRRFREAEAGRRAGGSIPSETGDDARSAGT